MHIETIVVGEFQVNSFVIWARPPGAIVIDPGADECEILEVLKDNKLTVSLYLLTHGHYDHVSAVKSMFDKMPAPVAIHGEDLKWAFTAVNQMPPFYVSQGKPEGPILQLADGNTLTAAGLEYRIVHTPGHTPGSVCIYFPDQKTLFTGDTLFAGSVGRTDLPGGNPRQMQASLKVLAEFPGGTTVYPGHGPASSIENEKRTNYFMQRLEIIDELSGTERI